MLTNYTSSRPGITAAELITDYDRYLRRRGRSASTRLQYSYPLRSFNEWACNRDLGRLSGADLERFFSWWEESFEARRRRPPCRATVRNTIGALRGFFEFLDRSGLLTNEDGQPLRSPMLDIYCPPHEQRANDYLRLEEDEALLACPSSEVERTIIWLLRWTGLRASEALALRVEDVTLTPGNESLLVRESKTAAGRGTVPVVPQLIPILASRTNSLARAGLLTASPTPLLATRYATPMTHNQLWRVVKRVAARAGVRVVPCTCDSRRVTLHRRGCPRTVSGDNRSGVTPHTLRRTFGSDLLNKGLRLEVVSKLLGHANTTITERAYAHLLGSTIRSELLEALGQLSRVANTAAVDWTSAHREQ